MEREKEEGVCCLTASVYGIYDIVSLNGPLVLSACLICSATQCWWLAYDRRSGYSCWLDSLVFARAFYTISCLASLL